MKIDNKDNIKLMKSNENDKILAHATTMIIYMNLYIPLYQNTLKYLYMNVRCFINTPPG